ncbi:hypothetical protein CCAX7_39310 [Capsulimonas corticalis]|uniref:Uncharacterized protein n=1 Tax=Capsulimonas corticalis TaxID=2219043 RepID=A0A402D3H8_9BACT|nr:hypothetical protein CCAX7_39310 [Capsulimonas corticalis]
MAIVLIVAASIWLGFVVAGHFQAIKRQEARVARQNHQNYLNELRLARVEGFALDTSSFNTPAPPAGDDAGLIYNQIFVELMTHPLSKEERAVLWIATGRRLPSPSDVTRTRVVLAERKDLLRRIHQATARSQCDFHIQWGSPHPYADFAQPDWKMDDLARLISAEALILAEDGKFDDAIRDQVSVFRIADHARAARGVSSCSSNLYINARALRGLQLILRIGADHPDAVTSILKNIPAKRPEPSLARAMRDQTTIDLMHLEQLRQQILYGRPNQLVKTEFYDWTPLRKFSHNSLQWNSYVDANLTAFLQRRREEAAVADETYANARPRLQASSVRFQKYSDPNYLLIKDIDFDITSNIRNRPQVQALIVTTQTAAKLLLWKHVRGTFPAQLSAMGSSPIDPYNAKPLHYRREGTGFVVYSVGEVGTFDGGSPTVKSKHWAPMFRYPTPPYDLAAEDTRSKS